MDRQFDLAPICLFVYNRPVHAKKTIDHLIKNDLADQSILYVFSDGPKSNDSTGNVAEVRDIIGKVNGFKEIHVIEQEHNQGLANSIINGATKIIEQYGSAIIVEDDILTPPYFLTFMNKGLQKYADNKKVASIHAYCYPVRNELPETFFIKGADCWGWATWKRAWDIFEPNGVKLLEEIKQKGLKREFNFNNTYNYYKMLKNQVKGKNDSWAVRWYASAFLANMYTLYPYPSLVHNIGFDNTGEHSGSFDKLGNAISYKKIQLKDIEITDNKTARAEFEQFFKSLKSISALAYRIKKRLKHMFNG
jgi:hypothetical protein